MHLDRADVLLHQNRDSTVKKKQIKFSCCNKRGLDKILTVKTVNMLNYNNRVTFGAMIYKTLEKQIESQKLKSKPT